MGREAARRQLLEIYARTLRAVAGGELVLHHLRKEPVAAPCRAVAIGKAAEAMALGAQQALGTQLQRGLLITKHGYLSQPCDPRWVCLEAGHPLPDDASLRAGQLLLAFLHQTPDDCHLLFLISGGTSSLVEVLPAGVTPELLQQVNHWLLGSGLDIDAVNRVRKAISAIKAGRLANHVCGRSVTQLLLSDVPGNDPRVIGSGLLVRHVSSDLETSHLPLPAWLSDLLERTQLLPEQACYSSITTHLLASNSTARLAAQQEAVKRGYSVVLHDYDFQGRAELLGKEFARKIQAEPSALHIWGGEGTMKLPPHPGRGGRCQQLALSAAIQLAGSDGLLLAAGTDGSDGPGDDAGALVDSGTLERGELEGLNASLALREADAGRFLEASGDLIQTGPTGSNVMDLVLGWNPADRMDTMNESLFIAAKQCLDECDPERKVEQVHHLYQAWHADELTLDESNGVEPIGEPGRPAKPILVLPRDLPQRKPNTLEGRAILFHALTHIEFNAINLALDAVYRFRGLPRDYYSDWLQVADEEATHFVLLRDHLRTLGCQYGDYPAHNGLWEMAQKTAHDGMVRMALVPRCLEARGLDVNPGIKAKLVENGDTQGGALLDIILRDEIGHVAIGNRWFFHYCQQRGSEPESTYRQLLDEYLHMRLRPPFHLEARRAAGFTEAELAYLEGVG